MRSCFHHETMPGTVVRMADAAVNKKRERQMQNIAGIDPSNHLAGYLLKGKRFRRHCGPLARDILAALVVSPSNISIRWNENGKTE
jgi:hypothetical protein